MAEFLRLRTDIWKFVPEGEKAIWSQKILDKYNRRQQEGDIIVVKPDGWTWAPTELGNVIYRPDIPYEEAKIYIKSDCEHILYPEIKIKANNGFFTDAELKALTKVQAEALLEEKKLEINYIEKVNLTKVQLSSVSLSSSIVIQNRMDLEDSDTDKYNYYAIMTDERKIKIDTGFKVIIYRNRRFKIEQNGNIYDKYLEEQVA